MTESCELKLFDPVNYVLINTEFIFLALDQFLKTTCSLYQNMSFKDFDLLEMR